MTSREGSMAASSQDGAMAVVAKTDNAQSIVNILTAINLKRDTVGVGVRAHPPVAACDGDGWRVHPAPLPGRKRCRDASVARASSTSALHFSRCACARVPHPAFAPARRPTA